MMSDTLKTLAGPTLALFGTLCVALLGYRQWRKQQDVTRFGSFLTERQAAYRELWKKLEELHLVVRSGSSSAEDVRELVRGTNVQMMQAALVIDRDETLRVTAYVDALTRLHGSLLAAEASESRDEAQRTMSLTGAVPEDVLAQVDGLLEATTAVTEARDVLLVHIRTVLGAQLFT